MLLFVCCACVSECEGVDDWQKLTNATSESVNVWEEVWHFEFENENALWFGPTDVLVDLSCWPSSKLPAYTHTHTHCAYYCSYSKDQIHCIDKNIPDTVLGPLNHWVNHWKLHLHWLSNMRQTNSILKLTNLEIDAMNAPVMSQYICP